jgi:hypothetical protein
MHEAIASSPTYPEHRLGEFPPRPRKKKNKKNKLL